MSKDKAAVEPTVSEPDLTLRYAEALEELEQILSEIEQDAVDLDDLGERVERAAHLIQICREKIERTEMHVKRIVEGLEQDE